MRALFAISAIATIAAVPGCGGPDESTPVACLDGPGTYVTALRDAPNEVRLSGETPISDCLAENQQGGDLATVGAAMVDAATELNVEARKRPGSAADLRLGYLLGAAQRGADRTGGIHAELMRRLAVAARYSPDNMPLPPAFMRAYRRGYDAGNARG